MSTVREELQRIVDRTDDEVFQDYHIVDKGVRGQKAFITMGAPGVDSSLSVIFEFYAVPKSDSYKGVSFQQVLFEGGSLTYTSDNFIRFDEIWKPCPYKVSVPGGKYFNLVSDKYLVKENDTQVHWTPAGPTKDELTILCKEILDVGPVRVLFRERKIEPEPKEFLRYEPRFYDDNDLDGEELER